MINKCPVCTGKDLGLVPKCPRCGSPVQRKFSSHAGIRQRWSAPAEPAEPKKPAAPKVTGRGPNLVFRTGTGLKVREDD